MMCYIQICGIKSCYEGTALSFVISGIWPSKCLENRSACGNPIFSARQGQKYIAGPSSTKLTNWYVVQQRL